MVYGRWSHDSDEYPEPGELLPDPEDVPVKDLPARVDPDDELDNEE